MPEEVPEPEICDGLDNDLDGEVDEHYDVGAECTVGVGGCARTGKIQCGDDGSAQCSTAPGEPLNEQCDSIDNDCDGVVDENFELGTACTAGLGECALGQKQCDGMSGVSCISNLDPEPETCDLLDNDCDGFVDEDFVGNDGSCTVGLGACAVPGWFECTVDGLGANCVPTIEQPPSTGEICDGIDNDCNGVVDDGIPC